MIDPMQNKSSTSYTGYLFSSISLLAMICGLVLAVWQGWALMVMLLGLILSTAGLTRLWSQFSLMGVSCQQELSGRKVFPGEKVGLRLSLVNRKLLPLPWVHMDTEIPLRLEPGLPVTNTRPARCGYIRKAASLSWFGSVTWTHTLHCNKRGYYTIGPVTVSSGDLFAFYPRSMKNNFTDHLCVYPRILPMHKLGMSPLYPLIETAAKRRIFEDPTRIIGVRDYRAGDNIRHIHWKVTARYADLKTKVFEPTTAMEVAIFLMVDTFSHATDDDEKIFETAISQAATAAKYIEEHGGQIGIFANSRLVDSRQPAVIAPGRGISQLTRILEALARVTSDASCPFEDFWEKEQKSVSAATTLIFVLSRQSLSTTGIFNNLKARGFKVIIMNMGSGADDQSDAVAEGPTLNDEVGSVIASAGGAR